MNLAERRGFDLDVYEPAEDSRLLAVTIERDLPVDDRHIVVLDVGTGSGYIGAMLTEYPRTCVVGADLNPWACRRARRRGLTVVHTDLVDGFCANVFDVVVFNPPYLPAVLDSSWDDWFELAVTGGPSGRETIERFFDAVGRVLKREGVIYLLVSTATGIDQVVEYAANKGYSAIALEDAVFPGETLTVLKFIR
jgi:release factor glutamine methyltransferase